MNINLSWISSHWTILTLVFAAGGAYSYQETQIETIEQVVIKQAEIDVQQQQTSDSIIRLEEQFDAYKIRQDDMNNKLDLLLEIQLERMMEEDQ